jgi:hypothetical protein
MKRFLRTSRPDELMAEARRLDVEARRSRNPEDPDDCYAIEGPLRVVQGLVDRFNEEHRGKS